MRGIGKAAALVACGLACACVTAGAAPSGRSSRPDAGGGLWGSENLIGDAAVEPGDVVTVVIASGGGHQGAPRAAAARVVKLLPNGNAVLEARLALGGGYILIGGEASRADLHGGAGAGWTVDACRMAKLAVVTRGLEAKVLAALVRAFTDAGPSGPHGDRRRFASSGPPEAGTDARAETEAGTKAERKTE